MTYRNAEEEDMMFDEQDVIAAARDVASRYPLSLTGIAFQHFADELEKISRRKQEVLEKKHLRKYWKVRLCRRDGPYATCQIATARNLSDIEVIKHFYKSATWGEFVIEAMSEVSFENTNVVYEAFNIIFKSRKAET